VKRHKLEYVGIAAIAVGAFLFGVNLGPQLNTAGAATVDDGFAWRTWIANYGDQKQVDECTGGLTDFLPVSDWLGRPNWAIHAQCGGLPVLTLTVGDQIYIHPHGAYEVIETRDINPGPASQIQDMPGDAILQTSHRFGQPQRRAVAIQQVSVSS